MPSLGDHKKQSAKNRKFFQDISDKFDSDYFDWKITTLFYDIVHCAEALYANEGKHSGSHSERNEFLKKKLDRKDFNLYLQLKNASKVSRYGAEHLTKKSNTYCIDIYQKAYLPLKNAFESKYLSKS